MQDLTFRVQRYLPGKDSKPYMQEFTVPMRQGLTVLDGLIYIKENLDNTLSFRSSCRMGICGSCGMLINNFPMLACHTPVEELNTDTITVKSLPNFPIIRDLVADLDPLFEKHRSIDPYIVMAETGDLNKLTAQFLQSGEELQSYLQFAYCVKCGLCMAACPTVSTDEFFLGPQPLCQGYRYCTDRRDTGAKQRFEKADSGHGVWLCHLAGACSEACPKGVDPALAIQLLKRAMVFDSLRLRKKPEPATPAQPIAESKPKIEVPEFTVKQ
ncbi:MAG TPA: succinate dehydrogenase iron-sulfur subunit [Dehalococcoidia bacterium]|nr:succinate dehydrogenase iron-sulfur subunit [Dehalococcoidia bacterium]